MCRLALFNTAWLQQIEEIELKGLFKTLNDKNGGHGIGVALCYDKSSPVIHKGVNLDPIEIASLVYGEKDNPDLRYIIYHARLASAAKIEDKLCHPFSEEKLFGLTMAHNGHVRQFGDSDTHSDTAIVFNLVTQFGLPLDFMSDLSGVFVGVHKKIPFVIKATSYSELDLAYTPDYAAFCFCSNFYQYTEKFRKRFIVEKHLNTFNWSKRITAKEVDKMYSHNYEWSINNAQKPLHTAKTFYSDNGKKPESTIVEKYNEKGDYIRPNSNEHTYIEGYGHIKTRNLGGKITYHAQHCTDWYYCEGECLEMMED